MAELNINEENMYSSEHIKSDVKCKSLLDYHYEAYNEYKGHLEKIIGGIKTNVLNLKKVNDRINSNDNFLSQLEAIENERQNLYKNRNDYFQSKKFTNPDQATIIEDSIARQSINKDENYNYIGGANNLVFDLSCIKDKPRYAEAILRQTSISVDYIKLSDDQIDHLKDIVYSEINPTYWVALDDLDTIEEELILNKQYIENHLSTLLEDLL